MAKRPVPKYDFKAFGAAIKAARKERKESRKQVSDEMYISPRYLANIENKGQHPSLQIFYELVARYNISVDQFFFPEAGKVSNLMLACYSCNRGKTDLIIDEDHLKTLNPDDGSIAQVFDRSEDYYIRIRPDYAEDPLIVDFYQKLLLGSEFRRLDYLLLEIKNFISTQRTSNPTVAAKLEQCFGALILKRNKTLI